jgi:hypothetical protein
MSDRLTGKASAFFYNGIPIPITKATHKATRDLANTTDNGDYVQQIDLLTPTQIPTAVTTEFAIEGRYRKSSTPSAIIAALYTGVTAVPAQLYLDASTLAGHGNFDISEFQTDCPDDDVVTFTANMKSNGQFTPNA